MAIRNIVKDGDEILTKVCRPVEKFDEKLGVLLDDMIETMKSADGVGLAAPPFRCAASWKVFGLSSRMVERRWVK